MLRVHCNDCNLPTLQSSLLVLIRWKNSPWITVNVVLFTSEITKRKPNKLRTFNFLNIVTLPLGTIATMAPRSFKLRSSWQFVGNSIHWTIGSSLGPSLWGSLLTFSYEALFWRFLMKFPAYDVLWLWSPYEAPFTKSSDYEVLTKFYCALLFMNFLSLWISSVPNRQCNRLSASLSSHDPPCG